LRPKACIRTHIESDSFFIDHIPLIGAFLNAVLGRGLPRKAVEVIACTALLSSLCMAVVAFIATAGQTRDFALFQWFGAEIFRSR